ncbi:mechanosensitive ion channel family protein [Caulobacter sp. NIBR2454]|uniref:mechanosensitive ion channel family protein n=1 Tax=Caulobacter sp. NIBR2454 TaxID=3015996 RepID=UPI0022B6ED54|nr:mechanosensitive ion channel domain-containing protein [Caulobacter sp. NIBR2454]
MTRKEHAGRSVALALIASGGLPGSAWAAEDPKLAQIADFVQWSGVALSVVVVAAALLILRMLEGASARLSKRYTHRRPTIDKVASTVRFAIYLTTIVLCAALSVRLNETALTVIGGGLAFAVGFAMRDLVAAFIAGITIIFDRPFQVGDRVSFAGQYGDIIKIGPRSVRMNTLDHNIITIPNNKVLTDITSSGNYGNLEMQVAMDFYVGVDQDVERATEIITEACLTSPFIFFAMPVPILIKQTILDHYVAVHIKARPYVFDCKYEKPFETDVHFRVLSAFSDAGIGPPAILHRHI